MAAASTSGPAGDPPGPAGAQTLDELVRRLRRLHAWSGLSYRELHRQLVRSRAGRGIPELPAYNTVYRALQPGRRRLDVELVEDIARVLLARDGTGDAGAAGWRQAYQAIAGAGAAGADAVATVLDGLPEDLAEFTGRRAELERLLALLDPAAGGTATVSVISGMAGVGKTSLAIRAAHQLRRAGQSHEPPLVVNLRGYDPELPPADPAAVLDGFLRRLGVPGDRVHGLDLAGRVAEYRRILAARCALVVLDNAASAAQVRPLLPACPTCRTLVTSRSELTGLPEARQVALDAFTPTEAHDFLCRVAGTDLIDADPETAARLADQVGHLPLALGLVASRIRASPGWPLTDHLARLAERRRVGRLDHGVELALAVSYEALPAEHQRILRLAALHPGRDLDGYAVAALAGIDLATARAHLDALAAGNLLRRRPGDRYEFHDLVHVYATDQARDRDPASVRRAALTRLLDHYRYAAARAMDAYAPHERHRRPAVPDPGGPAPSFDDRDTATGWLDAERPNLVAAAGYASAHPAGHDAPGFAEDLSTLLFRYLDTGAHHRDAAAVHTCGSRTGDPAGSARALSNLGVTSFRLGRYDDAVDQLRRALAGARAADDRATEGRSLGHLGNVCLWLGRFEDALDYHEQAVSACRALGDRVGEGVNLGNLGNVCWRLGRYPEAIDYYLQDLAIARETGDRAGEGLTLGNLGAVYERLARYPEAIDHHRQALAIAHETGDRVSQGRTLGNLGVVYHRAAQDVAALDHHRQALTITRETGDQQGECDVLNGIGTSLRSLGSASSAIEHHQAALTVAEQLGEPVEQARAHDGIAHARLALGDPGSARTHWRRALALYTALGTPEADEVAGQLRHVETATHRQPAPGPAR